MDSKSQLVASRIKNKDDFLQIFGLQGSILMVNKEYLLPETRNINFKFIRSVLTGDKKLLKMEQV